MTFADLEIAIKQEVEDVNLNLFSATEVTRAANESLQETMDEIKRIDPNFPLTKATITFASADLEKDLPTSFETLVLAEDEDGKSVQVCLVQSKGEQVQMGYYIYQTATGQWKIGRTDSGEAKVLTVWYVSQIADCSTGDTTTSIAFMPRVAKTLVVVRAANQLLSNRGRDSKYKIAREQKLSLMLLDKLHRIGSPKPAGVVYIEDN
jgi:hypothetical protein